MTDTYTLPRTDGGLLTLWDITFGLRHAGYRTRVVEATVCGFPVYKLYAVQRPRPNRKARGCFLGR